MNSSPDAVDFSRSWQIIKKHWLSGSLAFLSVFTIGAIATYLREDVYRAEAKLKLDLAETTATLGELRSDQTAGRSFEVNQPDILVATELEILRSMPLVEQTIAALELEEDAIGKPLEAKELAKRLRVSVLPSSKIFKVAYTSENSAQAAKVVNTLIKNYLHNNQVNQSAATLTTRKLLETQLSELEQAIQQTATAIRELQENYDFVAPTEQTKILIQAQQELQQEISTIKGQLANGRSQADYLRQQLALATKTTPSTEPETSDDILQQKLTQDLIKLEANNQGLQQQLASLEESLANYQVKIQQIPELEVKLSQLTREAKTYQSTYETVWRQLENLKLNPEPDLVRARVISDAVVSRSLVHSRPFGYLAAAGLATLSALGVVKWLIINDKSIATIEEAKQIYGYDWLGIIPNTEQINRLTLPETEPDRDPSIPKLIVRDYPALPYSESYRMLQSNIKFLRSEQAIKTIVITSSAFQEGKSTIAANLATAMAQVGSRVLLVDANLHSPMQHRIWNIYNDSGLSNVVAEQLNPLMTIKQVMPNLDLLTSGSGSLSAATLIDSQRMRMLIDYWSEQYDFVLFDTPSLGMAADAIVMSRMADGVILVVRPGFVERSQATFAKEILAQSGLNMLGVIFNGVTPQFEPTPFLYQNLISQQAQLQQDPQLIGESDFYQDRFWETLNAIVKDSPSNPLAKNLDERELLLVPLAQLENTVFILQQDLGDLTNLVKEQEEELFNQRQKVKQLQRQLSMATRNEYFDLEHQLSQEQEKKQMLDQTLVGQRRNLEKRLQMLHQYQQVLASRKDDNSKSASGL